MKRKKFLTQIIVLIFCLFLVGSFQGREIIKAKGFEGTNFPHIKTWGLFVGNSVPGNETLWAAERFDIMSGAMFSQVTPSEVRAINPNIQLCSYFSIPSLHNGSFPIMEEWANDNGYDYEDFFLHYTEDTIDNYWYYGREAKGWREECSPDSCDPPATASSPEEARVWATWYPRPDWRLRNFNQQSVLFEVYKNNLWSHYDQPDPPECVMLDSVPVYTIVLELLDIGKTDVYGGIPIDYNHPMVEARFQFGLDFVNEVQNQYDLSLAAIPNATATSTNLSPAFKSRFEDMYDWVLIERWAVFKNLDTGPDLTSFERSYQKEIVGILRQTMAGEKRLIRGNEYYGRESDRGKIFLLGSYYLINNENTYLNYKVVNSPDGNDLPSYAWFEAIGYDIGYPVVNPNGQADFDGNLNTSEHYEWATGKDPADQSKTYHIFARHYSNALTLVKYRPQDSTIGEISATTHDLDGLYKPLNADGTLGEAISAVTLRNNEAAILIPVDETAPGNINDLSVY